MDVARHPAGSARQHVQHEPAGHDARSARDHGRAPQAADDCRQPQQDDLDNQDLGRRIKGACQQGVLSDVEGTIFERGRGPRPHQGRAVLHAAVWRIAYGDIGDITPTATTARSTQPAAAAGQEPGAARGRRSQPLPRWARRTGISQSLRHSIRPECLLVPSELSRSSAQLRSRRVMPLVRRDQRAGVRAHTVVASYVTRQRKSQVTCRRANAINCSSQGLTCRNRFRESWQLRLRYCRFGSGMITSGPNDNVRRSWTWQYHRPANQPAGRRGRG